jgi:hypothetical protein
MNTFKMNKMNKARLQNSVLTLRQELRINRAELSEALMNSDGNKPE